MNLRLLNAEGRRDKAARAVLIAYVTVAALVSLLVFRRHDTETAILAVVAMFVGLGIVSFILFFVIPWYRSRATIMEAVAELLHIRERMQDEQRNVNDLEDIRRIFSSPLLSHEWTEFEDTLHAQHASEADEYGIAPIERYRQTVPADVYFSHTALVEIPLRTEFFKHLPGILTGLGIIGTFFGLIIGLGQFDVSAATKVGSNATEVLIDSVHDAFFVSLFAIAAAMLITALEKSMVNGQIARVSQLCEALDHLFEAGAGEEYLARLVTASEEGAAQTTQLKDALVAEISEVLERLTLMQIEALREAGATQTAATRESATLIADEMSRQIRETFEEPLRHVAESISTTNQSTQERVGSLLEDLLAQFSQQVESMFGDQIGELTSLLQQTSGMMQSTVERFEKLGVDIEDAGRRATTSMATELQTHLAAIAAQLGGEMARVVEQVQGATEGIQTRLLESQERLNAAAQSSLNQLTGQIAESNAATAAATRDMQSTVESLSSSTQDAMELLEASARRLESTATLIYQGGRDLADNLQAAGEIVGHLRDTTTASDASLTATRAFVEKLRTAAHDLSESAGALQPVLEAAKRDAETTSELVRGMEQSAASLATARNDTTDFLSSVQEALVSAHETFAREAANSLQATTKVFHQDLETATRQLSGVVKELGEVLDEIVDRRPTV